eukprot:CAMPEP_0198219344 /NCGR_PEP_ID=MMETSP1445-20131203/73866_1 /TAXON_ID=36898 /ORGANISM="Pyramimonas sp., Strain CCMP2087" /LENGTH=67 /DNA_ID=CAMNT_0043896723 /DNA_START=20 /DNA_END=220 /DNA_ORIENTATION=-
MPPADTGLALAALPWTSPRTGLALVPVLSELDEREGWELTESTDHVPEVLTKPSSPATLVEPRAGPA